jgi:group I intron endonuclease
MDYYIYITTNLINGKQYIGQHKGKADDAYLGSGTTLLKAIEKYGKNNFSKQIICYCQTREEADAMEKYIIAMLNAVEDNHFYNNSEGGSGGDGWRAYRKWVQEHPDEAKLQWQQNGQRLQQWLNNQPKEFRTKQTIPMLEGSRKYWQEHPDELKQHLIQMNEAKLKWQQEHPKEHLQQIEKWQKMGSQANSQKIRCINTGEIFNSISEASRKYNVPQPNISKCLKGERQSAGKHPITNEKLLWKKL